MIFWRGNRAFYFYLRLEPGLFLETKPDKLSVRATR